MSVDILNEPQALNHDLLLRRLCTPDTCCEHPVGQKRVVCEAEQLSQGGGSVCRRPATCDCPKYLFSMSYLGEREYFVVVSVVVWLDLV